MDSGPSVAAGTKARCPKLLGCVCVCVCVFWKLRLEEVVTGGSEVHAGLRWTWAMQGSALPVLWQHPLSIYHSLTHQPNFQLQEAHEDSPAAGSHSASVHGRPEMPGNNASQEQRSTCDRWELVSDYPSSLPSGELSDVQTPQSLKSPGSWSAWLAGCPFLSCLISPLLSPLLSGITPWKVPALKSLSQGLLLVKPKLRCWQSAE